MIIVNIADANIPIIVAGRNNAHLFSIRNPEFLIVVTINEANPFGGPLQVRIQPIPLITVAVDVIHTGVRIQPEHIGVICGIQPETIIMISRGYQSFRMRPTVVRQRSAAFKKCTIGPVCTKDMDDCIEFIFEFLGFEVCLVVIPGREELFAGAVQIASQVPNTPGHSHDLLRLGVAIHLLHAGHGAYRHLHTDHLPSLSALFLSAMTWKESTPGTSPRCLPLSKSQ